MSLIQEALKRQEEEARQQGTDTVTVPPPKPPPDADEGKNDLSKEEPGGAKKPKNSKPWAVLLGALAVVLLLVGGAIWMLMTAVKTVANDVAETATATAEEAIAAITNIPAETTEPLVAAESEPSETADTSAPPAVAVQPQPAPAETHPAELVSVPPPAEAVAPAVESAPAVIAPPPDPVATVPQPADAKPGEPWPLLKVSGVVGRGRYGSAVINGKVVAVGELIEGVKVLSVDSRGAQLMHEGISRHVRVGSSTDR
jgi:cytoskeletal protein RodZ